MNDSTQRAIEIAAQLGESGEVQLKQVERAWATCGDAVMQTLLDEVKDAESSGRMPMTIDGKPRTRGGMFFVLLRKRIDADAWFYICHGRERRMSNQTAMRWDERREAIQEAQVNRGRASWTRVSAVGQVKMDEVEVRDGYVLVTLYGGDHIPPLPKGLPMPPSMATTFKVGIAASQWRSVERLARQGDTLIVSGYPVPNENKGRVAVYAIKVTTSSLKQSKFKARAR